MSETTPTDLEYPQLWENYGLILSSRQRMLQSALAFYVASDDSVKALYECEVQQGIPKINYLPTTTQGKNALSRYTVICNTYTKVLCRFKDTYDF